MAQPIPILFIPGMQELIRSVFVLIVVVFIMTFFVSFLFRLNVGNDIVKMILASSTIITLSLTPLIVGMNSFFDQTITRYKVTLYCNRCLMIFPNRHKVRLMI